MWPQPDSFWNCDSAASFHHLLQNHPETAKQRFRDGFLIAGFFDPLHQGFIGKTVSFSPPSHSASSTSAAS